STLVAIVNETLASRLWPNQDPVGKRLFEQCERPGVPRVVVGVARNSKYLAVFETPLPYLYLPQTQNPSFMRVLQIRSALAPSALEAAVRHEIELLDPDLPLVIETMDQSLENAVGFLLFR